MQNRFSYKLLTQAFHPLNNLVYNSLLVVPQTNRVIISVERIKANIHILVISKIWGRCNFGVGQGSLTHFFVDPLDDPEWAREPSPDPRGDLFTL